MAYITKRRISVKSNKAESTKTHNNKWNHFYQNRKWKRLRDWFMSNHYICADCAIEGRSTPAEQVHHKVPFAWFTLEEDKMAALLDIDNLVPLCRECHLKRHKHLIKPDDFEKTEYYKKIHSMS